MQKKIIIGYSIDAVLEAISILTQSDKTEVVFYATGPLGSPLDNFNDYISNNDIMLLLQFLPKLKYSYIYNPEYIYIPYDKIKFKTSSNGFIQYPFTKTSFDDEKEWKCVSTSLKNNNIKHTLKDITKEKYTFPFYQVEIGSIEDNLKFYNYLYSDNPKFFLKRKFDKFNEVISK